MKNLISRVTTRFNALKAKQLIGLAVLLTLSGYILTGVVVWATNQRIEQTLKANLQEQLAQFVRLTERRFSYFEQVLQGNAALVKSTNVTAAEFADICKDDAVAARRSGADYLVFVSATSAGSDDATSFRRVEGDICNLEKQSVEPFRADWANQDDMRAALTDAGANHRVVLIETKTEVLPAKYVTSRAFYFVYPVYAGGGKALQNPGRTELLGWMLLVSRYGHLKQILQDDYEPNIGFTISRAPQGAAVQEPLISIGQDHAVDINAGKIHARQSVAFGGQPWTYDAVYANDFWFQDLRQAVFVIQMAGFVLSTLIGFIVLLLGGRLGDIDAFVNSLKKRLTDSEQFSRDIVTSLAEGVYLTDLDGKITFVNPEASRMLGYEVKDMLGVSDHQLFHDWTKGEREIDANYCSLMVQVLRGDIVRTEQENFRRKDGSLMPVALMASPVYRAYKLSGMLVSFRDISGEKLAKSEIWWRANFDALTGLPNRNLFFDRLKLDISRSIRDGHMLGLLFIDLDGFKAINDSRGHEVGDQLLVQVANRISSCLRESDTVSRLGGDEFTVILARQEDALDIQRIAEKIRIKLFEPIMLNDGYVAQISCSIGIALCPQDTMDMDELLVNADNAMYESKRLGRNRINFSSEHIRQAAEFRQMVISDLRKAIDRHQLSFELQPILHVPDRRIVKAELLARWQHHERGMIPPDEFITIAEKSGAIIELGNLIFSQAIDWLKQHRQELPAGFQLSINVSPIQFQVNQQKARIWLENLAKADIPPEMICVEMTESALLFNHANTVNNLDALRAAGVAVALDDFGSGYASLANLRHFSIDLLKIDRQFIAPMTEQPDERAITEGMINLAHQLGITVVAEGVETTDQYALLAGMGCEFIQGYWVSRPLPPEQFMANMQAANWTVV